MPRYRWWAGLVFGLVVLAASLSWMTAGAPADDEPPGRKIDFLVGVNSYDHSLLNPLRYPENDVAELAETLRQQQFQVVLLTTSAGKKNPRLAPTAENIQRELGSALKKATRRDLIVVGLAGHGIQPLGSDLAYFCPQDGNPTTKAGKQKDGPNIAAFPETLISIDETLETLGNSGIGQTVVLVDACRNDPGVRGRRGVDRVRVQALPANTVVLLSCSPGQFAFEHETWGKGGHGAFFSQVIEGLHGAAADETGNVTYHELSGFLRKRVPALVRKTYGKDGGEQQPNIITNTSAEPLALATVTPRQQPAPEVPTGLKAAPEKTPSVPAMGTNDGAEGEAVVTNTIGMKFRLIPKGNFLMGSPESEKERSKDETQHRVGITKAFYLGKYEVTQAEFQKIMGRNPSKFSATGANKFDVENLNTDRCPVENVSWYDAVEFCNKLSELEQLPLYYRMARIDRKPEGNIVIAEVTVHGGKGYRLPTEAEWEYTCRAGTETPFQFDTEYDGQDSNIDGNYPYGTTTKGPCLKRTTSVGRYSANQFGLNDMHGNVCEWCQDWYDDKYYENSPKDDPLGAATGIARVLRGGSWSHNSSYSRSASRSGLTPGFRLFFIGFRVACAAPARTR